MCLYPRLIENRKYRATKKNGGVIPPILDQRTKYVPVGCQTCIECRKQKVREWMTRLQEDIKWHINGKFVTLTFSTEALQSLVKPEYKILKKSKFKFAKPPFKQYRPRTKRADRNLANVRGYDLDNAICIKAVRLFLERWRKRNGKSLRHFLVTEIGGGHSEHVHMHGIVWTDKPEEIQEVWKYGTVWRGYERNGKYENYINVKTVNYITKYINKIDEKHINYKPIVLCSAGIGSMYSTHGEGRRNKFKAEKTNETYRTESGYKIALPIYWRNKIYTEDEREKLWIQKLDKGERYVCGERIRQNDEDTYWNVVMYYRERSIKLGYPAPSFIWSKKAYEEQRRKMLQEKRLKLEGWIT